MGDKAYVQHLTRGGEHLRADRVEDAARELEQANQLRPGDGRILNLLGLAYFRLGRFPEARTIYGELAVKQPTDAGLRLNLGLVHLKLGDVEDAIRELDRARELDPQQQRTLGYLGLAYARQGAYARARDAFRGAGQEELAREMEETLAAQRGPGAADPAAAAEGDGVPGDGAKGSGSTGAPAEAPPAGTAADPAADGAGPAEPDARDGFGEGGGTGDATRAHPRPAALARALEAAAAHASSREAAGAAPPDGPGDEPALTGGEPTGGGLAGESPGSSSIGGGAARRAVWTIADFATRRLIQPDDGERPLEVAAGGMLVVRVRGKVYTRTEGVIASGGQLAYEPATRRVRGRVTDEPFTAEASSMFVASGDGHLVAAPRGATFTALALDDDILYARDELVFAFEDRLRWENGHIPGSSSSIGITQFRGDGSVALRTRRSPVGVRLAPGKLLYVDAGVVIGWIGRVVPRVVAPVAAGDHEASFLECTGEGIVLVEEPEAAPATGAA